ncbi:MAG: tRNA glutamyl-Q(34) synthetase GluQRS [Verrucomicrobiota bacterium]
MLQHIPVIVTRFAPSPTGRLHLGHAYSALFSEKTARDSGGKLLLRIEDIDFTRCKSEFEAGLLEDLEWLGIEWNGDIVRQSERGGLYEEALQKLDDLGLTYPCFCTRKEILAEIERAGGAPHGPEGQIYPGTCRSLTAAEREARINRGDPFSLRLDVAKAKEMAGALDWEDAAKGTQIANPALFGDFVIARKDIGTSYHLAVTVDDALQGVTLVTRGRDLLEATHLHRLLQALLDLPVPRWHHHELIEDESGKRLAKRDESQTLASLRAEGVTAREILERLGFS